MFFIFCVIGVDLIKKSKLFSLLPKGGSFEQSILQCVGVRIQE